MSEKVDKLILLALSTENISEAVAAMRQARKMQPKGKLKADQSPDWDRFERERDQMRTDREVFEKERTAFHRRILLVEENAARKLSAGTFARFGRSMRNIAGYTALTSMFFGGVAYAMISYSEARAEDTSANIQNFCGTFAGFESSDCAM